jgi:hypothetical protein
VFWYGTTGDCECGGRKDGVSSLEKMIFDVRHDHPSGIFVRVLSHTDISATRDWEASQTRSRWHVSHVTEAPPLLSVYHGRIARRVRAQEQLSS